MLRAVFLLICAFLHSSTGSTTFVYVGNAIADPIAIERPCQVFSSGVSVTKDHGPAKLLSPCFPENSQAHVKIYQEEDVKIIALFALMLSGKPTEAASHYKYRTTQDYQHYFDSLPFYKKNPLTVGVRDALQSGNFKGLDVVMDHSDWGRTTGWDIVESYMKKVDRNMSVFEILNIDHETVFDKFHARNTYGAILPADLFKYHVFCDFERMLPILKIEACFQESVLRVSGTLTMTPPKGLVVDNGIESHFRYYDVPNYAIITPRGPVSVIDCYRDGDVHRCHLPTDDCSVMNYEHCPFQKRDLFGGSFIKMVNDSYFVATVAKTFAVWNGTATSIHDVYQSGQMVINVPSNWLVTLGSDVLVGRSSGEFSVVPVVPQDKIVRGVPQEHQPLTMQQSSQAEQLTPESNTIVIHVPQHLIGQGGSLWTFISSDLPVIVSYAGYAVVFYYILKGVPLLINPAKFIINILKVIGGALWYILKAIGGALWYILEAIGVACCVCKPKQEHDFAY